MDNTRPSKLWGFWKWSWVWLRWQTWQGWRGDTADRATEFTGQKAALGCTGIYLAVLDSVDWTGLFQTVMGTLPLVVKFVVLIRVVGWPGWSRWSRWLRWSRWPGWSGCHPDRMISPDEKHSENKWFSRSKPSNYRGNHPTPRKIPRIGKNILMQFWMLHANLTNHETKSQVVLVPHKPQLGFWLWTILRCQSQIIKITTSLVSHFPRHW